MEIKSDRIEVAAGVRDPKTDQLLEPEQQPARRILTTDAAISLSGSGATGQSLASEISVEGEALEWAKAVCGLCHRCLHFDQDGWRKYLRHVAAAGSLDERNMINKIRAYLVTTSNAELQSIHSGNDGMDVEDALNSLGICRALTEIFNDMTVLHFKGGCPPEEKRGPKGEVLHNLFSPRDAEAEKANVSNYDRIMRAACGLK